jgi:membrane-bound metal-dependent hydrolase YbcI (DUF457 family)
MLKLIFSICFPLIVGAFWLKPQLSVLSKGEYFWFTVSVLCTVHSSCMINIGVYSCRVNFAGERDGICPGS